jgi:membrane protein implicated in regulation of membrane protease activity
MQNWWDTLTAIEKVFWLIAIPFSVIFIIQMVLSFTGIGGGATDPGADIPSDFHTDMSGENHDVTHSNDDAGPGFSFFTLRNFIAFFTIFSWSGIALNNAGLGNGLTILLAILLGILAMLIISMLFYFTMKMADSGNVSVNNAIGATGKVYIPIKANKGNVGKVQVTFQGSIREMQAVTLQDIDLPTNTIIKVTGIAGANILLVEKI